jgi:hypothetical protein
MCVIKSLAAIGSQRSLCAPARSKKDAHCREVFEARLPARGATARPLRVYVGGQRGTWMEWWHMLAHGPARTLLPLACLVLSSQTSAGEEEAVSYHT